MNRKWLIALAAVVACGVSSASAQIGNTTQGAFGTRTVGGGTGIGRATNSFGGTGSSLLGGQTGGNVAGLTRQSQANVGTLTGQAARAAGTNQPGQFVGRGNAPGENLFGGFGGGNTGGFGQQGRRQGAGRTNRNGNANRGGRNNTTTIAHRLQIAFGGGPVNLSQTSKIANVQLSLAGRFKDRLPVQVTVQGRTAILQGVVATEHDRDLAQRVALLESGISQVQNELSVAAPPQPPGPEAVDDPPVLESVP